MGCQSYFSFQPVLHEEESWHCSISDKIFHNVLCNIQLLACITVVNGYMASDIWLRTILIVRMETRCRHMGYSFRLTARVLLYAPSHTQDSTAMAFVTPVVEHWLEREIVSQRYCFGHVQSNPPSLASYLWLLISGLPVLLLNFDNHCQVINTGKITSE